MGHYYKQHGRFPTDPELAKLMDLSIEKVQQVKENARCFQLVSLNNFIGGANQDEDELIEVLNVGDAGSLDSYLQKASQGEIVGELARLPDYLRNIIMLNFGLGNQKLHTLEEISDSLGHRTTVGESKQDALEMLRHPSLRLGLSRYDERGWRADAACLGADPMTFFVAANKVDGEPAKCICRACPVNVQCLVFSLEHNVIRGIWGGVDMRSRNALIKRIKSRGVSLEQGIAKLVARLQDGQQANSRGGPKQFGSSPST